MDISKLKQEIKADANPEKLAAAIKRRDKSYIRGALQWYERKQPKSCLTMFLKQLYGSC
jgi:hypothetical protein